MPQNKIANIQRLNVLLRLPKVAVDDLDAAGWEGLLDELYWALYGSKQRVKGVDTTFHLAATKEGVKRAQAGVESQLYKLQKGSADEAASFPLNIQALYVFATKTGFAGKYFTNDLPSMVYEQLRFLLETPGVKQSDLLTCATDETVFVPLRKRAKHKPVFCSQKCASLASARAFRTRSKSASDADFLKFKLDVAKVAVDAEQKGIEVKPVVVRTKDGEPRVQLLAKLKKPEQPKPAHNETVQAPRLQRRAKVKKPKTT